MANAEAPFSVTFKNDGNLWTARGDSIDEFSLHVEQLQQYLAQQSTVTDQQAVQNLTTAGLVGQPAVPVPTVVPQPGFSQQQPAQAAASDFPPGVTYPGDCAHGRMVYHAKTAKVGERFECSIPWSRDAQNRCKTVWVNKR